MASTTISFYERVDGALHDDSLKTALSRATERFIGNRATAIGALSDEAALRDTARAIRAGALARLDELLVQLAANVESRGGTVCWASDGEEARRYIAQLAKDRGVRSIVKSKSMASEEIHLNHALEEAGLEVVETDLGEYIIQLAGETPSHIIAPSIHKTREQVSELFHQHLGVPLTDDIPTMTQTARRELRQRFLRADMGISGVNFGVADEGAVVIVENEGNARLSTTVPRIHVAIMGIERIVARMEDLGVMLQVLARSATGQKLSVYTSIISGPARKGEEDGPEEFHLVLLDNGRSKILGGQYAEALLCIRCGACLNACPVYQAIGGHAYGGVYSGPIGAVLTPLLQPDLPEAYMLPQASSLCGACQEVCPVRIAIPDMLLRLRADGVRAGKANPVEKAAMAGYAMTMNNPAIYRAGGRAARLGSRLIGRRGRIRRLPPPLSAWTHGRDFPQPQGSASFGEWWEDRERSRQK
ncbi:iron-sulfur cluster-binding protein [Oscillochloris sp. ZM17-4]|uniref:LutB/LldF family L-lactate oxidation iron-sulfur protein n=1 Tax=Oscillochloris sp. ZM17-4 TaxID=2866714 RepID=UPI001C73CE55|nr:LutB/LldF family L-lactate oxidation iron-sulfur protein [Oscillochloris sp. ZM17-4]MBX0327766.1 iron-sulfur cluster-binding protein [Oscillochloris sp. ZM17-4]